MCDSLTGIALLYFNKYFLVSTNKVFAKLNENENRIKKLFFLSDSLSDYCGRYILCSSALIKQVKQMKIADEDDPLGGDYYQLTYPN